MARPAAPRPAPGRCVAARAARVLCCGAAGPRSRRHLSPICRRHPHLCPTPGNPAAGPPTSTPICALRPVTPQRAPPPQPPRFCQLARRGRHGARHGGRHRPWGRAQRARGRLGRLAGSAGEGPEGGVGRGRGPQGVQLGAARLMGAALFVPGSVRVRGGAGRRRRGAAGGIDWGGGGRLALGGAAGRRWRAGGFTGLGAREVGRVGEAAPAAGAQARGARA
jgi:hypothetical protein